MTLGQKFSVSSSWSRDDDLAFERALAIYTDETESRWKKITAVVPGKTIEQIKEHYEILVRDVMMIESGCVPLPDYDFSEESNHNSSDNNRKCEFKQKKRKGIAWTSEEHREFLLGLEKYGKGDWRSISRHCVVTRTSTQVASHAQKYFARLNSKNKNKKRPSIHDITDVEGRSSAWQNKNNNVVVTSNTDQTTSQPSLDLPVYGTSNVWNTQATQTGLQPSLDHVPYGAPTIWNTQAVLQPTTVNIPPTYGMPIINQSMVGPMFLTFGAGMNHSVPPYMTYGVQSHSVPYSSVPNASLNIGSVPYNMNYIPHSGI